MAGLFLHSRVFARHLLRGNHQRNISFHISFWCLTWNTTPVFTSNKPTLCLLDYGDFNLIIPKKLINSLLFTLNTFMVFLASGSPQSIYEILHAMPLFNNSRFDVSVHFCSLVFNALENQVYATAVTSHNEPVYLTGWADIIILKPRHYFLFNCCYAAFPLRRCPPHY